MRPVHTFALALAAAGLPLTGAAQRQDLPARRGPILQPSRAAAASAAPGLDAAAYRRSRVWRLDQRQVRYAYFNQGDPREKVVTLTFDDGPDPVNTPRILDILKAEGVPATFFVLGEKAERYPELVVREATEGHDLGNHTYHHFELWQLNDEAIRFEIRRTNQALQKIVGGGTRWFRAPGCHYTTHALELIKQLGMVRVDTTDNSGDWERHGVGSLMRRTLSHLSSGDVILCHDRVPETVEALPKLIHAIRDRGYRFVPLAQLALKSQQNPKFKPPYWPPEEGIRIDAKPVTLRAGSASVVK